MKKLLIVVIVLAVIAFFLGSAYFGRRNQMAIKREAVNAAWAQMDVVLQRRADLIPNLVETVKDYNTYIALFPNSVVASMGGFARNDAHYKTEEGARQAPKVSFSPVPAPAPAKP